MFKKLSVATKLHIPIVLSLIVGLIILLIINVLQISNIEKRVYNEELKRNRRREKSSY